MDATDHERIAAARSKQRRKLASWFARQDQVGLAARRLEFEQQFASGEPVPPPDTYPEDDRETTTQPCAA